MTKVGNTAQGMVASFETAIEKEPAKATVPGGAMHPLTRASHPRTNGVNGVRHVSAPKQPKLPQ